MILVSIPNRLTISPAPRSANSGSWLNVLKYACSLTLATILPPLRRMRMARPVFAPAPMANVRARQAAATGKERPKKVSWGEEKKSMSFPMVSGMSMETEDETRS